MFLLRRIIKFKLYTFTQNLGRVFGFIFVIGAQLFVQSEMDFFSSNEKRVERKS